MTDKVNNEHQPPESGRTPAWMVPKLLLGVSENYGECVRNILLPSEAYKWDGSND
jgi:hypothetical protein